MSFLLNVLLLHDLPYYAMIIFVIIFYVMISCGNTTHPFLSPCTFTLTTVYKINCSTFLFNMSYSRIALKKMYSYNYYT